MDPLYFIVMFFVYGLSFFALGLAILVYPRRGSRFKLAGHLELIAFFGILHGINEWMDMFKLIRPVDAVPFKIVHLIILAGSFYFLVLFGTRILIEKKGKHPVLKAAPIILPILWGTFIAFSSQTILMGDIGARYLIGAPGIFLTCYALTLHIPEIAELGQRGTVRAIKVTTGTFLAYGVLAGLIVPEAPYFPASVLNYKAFFTTIGIPVQLFRTLCAIVLFYTITRVLTVFEWETLTSLRDARDRLEERVRERTEALHTTNKQLLSSIDEIKRTEGALRESEERLALAQRAGHVGVFDWDLMSNTIVRSEQLEELFGLPPGGLDNTYESWTTHVHPEDVERLQEFFQKWMQSGSDEEHWEYRFFRPDGEMRWLESRGRMMPDSSGRPLRIIGVSVDVTERKKAEEQITALNEELRRHIVQLQAANKELEAFSYSVSHDLRAPLRHLTGFVELLNKRTQGGLDEKSRHYLEVISSSASHMGRLIDDLLAFSRAGRVEMKQEKVDSDALVREAINELSDETSGRDVVWELQPLPRVFGDPALLRLAWINLISNALKFTRPREQALIEIGAEERGSEYVFYIKDNGVGFDIKYKDKLFGLFQRLHRPEEFEGTGVGLANVQRIVHRHGGRAWAKSILGEGATFYFSFPKHKEV